MTRSPIELFWTAKNNHEQLFNEFIICHLKACSTEHCGPSLEGRVARLDLDLDLEDLDLEEGKLRSEGKP